MWSSPPRLRRSCVWARPSAGCKNRALIVRRAVLLHACRARRSGPLANHPATALWLPPKRSVGRQVRVCSSWEAEPSQVHCVTAQRTRRAPHETSGCPIAGLSNRASLKCGAIGHQGRGRRSGLGAPITCDASRMVDARSCERADPPHALCSIARAHGGSALLQHAPRLFLKRKGAMLRLRSRYISLQLPSGNQKSRPAPFGPNE
jgi:hypothetical protein